MSSSLRASHLTAFDVVLIDVGNVLVYDAPIEMAFSYFVRCSIQAGGPDTQIGPAALLEAAQNRSIPEGCSVDMWADAVADAWRRVLDLWASLCIPIPGALEALKRIHPQRVAVIANQPIEMLNVLAGWGVVDLVEAVFLDSEIGLSKPDVALYRTVLKRLNVEAKRALMIGDRFDNDIEPAHRVGITTAWVQAPDPHSLPAVSVVPASWRHDYLAALEVRARTPAFDSTGAGVKPDFVLNGLADLFLGVVDRSCAPIAEVPS